VSQGKNKIDLTVPDGLSILAKNRPGATVQGINQVQAAEVAKYGPGSYVPVVWMAYWFFRLMIGFGVLAGLIGLAVLAQWRRGRLTSSPRLMRIATWTVALTLLANTAGWLFTETARQPWLVYGLLKTSAGISPNVSTGFVLTTLILFSGLYGVLGVICFRIVRRIAMAGPDTPIPPGSAGDLIDEPVLSLV
jgi:cytochrome d ubiquinol oxidase subunit I